MFNLIKIIVSIIFLTTLIGCKTTPPINTYHIDESNLYWTTPKYINSDAHVKYSSINNVDLTTFKVLVENKKYAKDKNYVYREGRALPLADPKSFQVINNKYSKDENYVYFESNIIDNANSESFEVINTNLSKDKNSVYFRFDAMIDADPENIKILYFNKYFGSIYTQSGANVYYRKTKFSPCDLKTFKVSPKNDSWSLDNKCVYYEGKITENIDPNTFLPINSSYGKDLKNVYYEGKVVKFADTETFKPNYRGFITAKDNKYCFIGEKIADCKDPIPGKKSKGMLSNMLNRMADKTEKENIQYLAVQQETISFILDKFENNYLTIDDVDQINLNDISKDFKWQIKGARNGYIYKRYNFKEAKKQTVTFNSFGITDKGVGYLVKNKKGRTLQEDISFHIMGIHGYAIYQNGKCELSVGSCIETAQIFKHSDLPSEIIPIKIIPIDISINYELSYQNGVWFRELINNKGEKIKEITIYDKSTFPIYYSMIKDGKLLMENVSESITLP